MLPLTSPTQEIRKFKTTKAGVEPANHSLNRRTLYQLSYFVTTAKLGLEPSSLESKSSVLPITPLRIELKFDG